MFISNITPNIIQDPRYSKYTNWAIIFLVLAGILGASWFGYSWYVRRYEQVAHKDLAESIDEYHRKLYLSIGQQEWQDIEVAFATGASRHKSSKLYPYFLAYQADALIHQAKYTEAIEVMNKMLKSLSSKQPLYYLYAIKRALMKIDAGDVMQKEGLAELEQLAQNTENPFQEMALYRLGLAQLHQGDRSQADKTWKLLLSKAQPTSGWYQLALPRVTG